MDSILSSIKKLLGLDVEDTSFDIDVMMAINTIIPVLSQMGVGPSNGFIVTSSLNTWNDYITDDSINLQGIKTYIYLRTKMIFDPPTNAAVITAINNNIKELEWRMMLAVETNNLEV